MKTVIACALLVAWPVGSAAKDSDASNYTIQVHVASSELKNECSMSVKGSDCAAYQYLAVTIGGKKFQLESTKRENLMLHTGDYQGRIVKDEPKSASEFLRIYELRFADGKTIEYVVVGESE